METSPSVNWKHPVDHFRPENGIYYNIYFLGSYPVNISIKTVEYRNRMKIARECIKRVCAQLGISLSLNKPADREVISSIGTTVNECGKVPVWIRITTETISVLNQQKTEELKRHNLQDISFACGGDQELLDYLSYVGKDTTTGRSCFVFQSNKEPAKDIILAIGQAFDLRFREYQKALLGNTGILESKNGHQNIESLETNQENEWGFRPIPNNDDVHTLTSAQKDKSPTQPIKPAVTNTTTSAAVVASKQPVSLCPVNEPWYLGAINRVQAEKLLKFDGSFLVRDSTQQPNQYVLSGKQNGQFKHLLLVDPQGKNLLGPTVLINDSMSNLVHTKDQEFSSIKHLIEYHQKKKLPITSSDSELHLLYPVNKLNT